jgi:hypothetical protein
LLTVVHFLVTLFFSQFPMMQERREREQQDLEYAKEMSDEDDDGFP